MSKKKPFSGSTMTLKDFHGGSIPSDLSLPSAPGVLPRTAASVAAADRVQSGWRGAVMRAGSVRADHRPRSAGGAGDGMVSRGIDDLGGPILPPSSRIGRHFDEDERKPFDAAAAALPRRPAPDAYLAPPLDLRGVTLKNTPVQAEAPRPLSASSRQGRNAWASGSGEDALAAVVSSSTALPASRFVQASAVDKVSSGRWHLKPLQHSTEAVVPLEKLDDPDRWFRNLSPVAGNNGDGVADRKRGVDSLFPRGRERIPVTDVAALAARDHETIRTLALPSVSKEPDSAGPRGGDEPYRRVNEGGHQDSGVERRRLKLLPRTKPMESFVPPAANDDNKQEVNLGFHPPLDNVLDLDAPERQDSTNPLGSRSTGQEGGSQLMERPRPKLNLKPRSHPHEGSDESVERGRNSVFGGARPRELVLQERGVDIMVLNADSAIPINSSKLDNPKAVSAAETISPSTRHGDIGENFQGIPFNNEQRWRNSMENGIEHQQRRQDPVTWRKPVEEPKPEPPPQMRYGKAVSALELAQAFSKSVSSDTRSEAAAAVTSASQKRIVRPQVPFSRLADTTS